MCAVSIQTIRVNACVHWSVMGAKIEDDLFTTVHFSTLEESFNLKFGAVEKSTSVSLCTFLITRFLIVATCPRCFNGPSV